MTKEQVAEALGVPVRCIRAFGTAPDKTTVEFDDAALTFEGLQRLAEFAGTRLIDIRYDAGRPDYSELTPGDPGSFTLIIREADERRAEAKRRFDAAQARALANPDTVDLIKKLGER